MSDLVERLRDERIWGQTHLRHEAADEIERLTIDVKETEEIAHQYQAELYEARAEIERLRSGNE